MSSLDRRQGLSRNTRPNGLLQNIVGVRENGLDVKEKASNMKVKVKEPVADDAPPLSSEDEDDGYDAVRRGDSSDSNDDRHKKSTADIQSTFRRESKLIPSTATVERKTSRGRETVSKGKESEAYKGGHMVSNSAGSKRAADKISGSHLTDANGFTRSKMRPGFGKSAQRLAQKPTRNYSDIHITSPFKGRFQKPPPIDSPSPVKNRNSSRNLKHHALDSSPPSSPIKQKSAAVATLDSSPEKSQKGFVKPELDSTWTTPQSQRSVGATRQGNVEEETSPIQKFRSHLLDNMEDLKDLSDNDSGPLPRTHQAECLLNNDDTELKSDSDLSSLDDSMSPKEPRCPMCHELVDPKLLKEFVAKGRVNVKKQTTFCRLHKRKEAEVTRKMKGYPKVEWGTLDSRLKEHDEVIKRILEGDQSSHYAAILNEKVAAGKGRTLFKAEEILTPGYYGPRGLRVMTDYIMKNFSSTVRRRAIEERLVSARGYSGYVQAVLVPELAVRLIMKDMSVSEEEAQNIMLESSDVGELVYEETRDVVQDDEER